MKYPITAAAAPITADNPHTKTFLFHPCRFLNADDTAFVGTTGTVLSGNIFAYCENNPISNADEGGYIAANVIGAVIGGIVGDVG